MITLFMVKILIALLALSILFTGVFGILRVFDKLLGIDFKVAFDKIEGNPVAMSIYFGLRFLGMAVAVGITVAICFIL